MFAAIATELLHNPNQLGWGYNKLGDEESGPREFDQPFDSTISSTTHDLHLPPLQLQN